MASATRFKPRLKWGRMGLGYMILSKGGTVQGTAYRIKGTKDGWWFFPHREGLKRRVEKHPLCSKNDNGDLRTILYTKRGVEEFILGPAEM